MATGECVLSPVGAVGATVGVAGLTEAMGELPVAVSCVAYGVTLDVVPDDASDDVVGDEVDDVSEDASDDALDDVSFDNTGVVIG